MNGHKKRTSLTANGMAAVLSCALFFSCNNEDFSESNNLGKAYGNICFGISSDENVRTRGIAGNHEDGYTSRRFVLRSESSADTLCVRAVVSDGINVSGFEGEQALTLGVPVDGSNFYEQFHVLAYWQKDGTEVGLFYMDENANKNGDIWSTEKTYYWPGDAHTFQFYAWAPTDADGLTAPSTPESKLIEYNVPEEAANQKDIVVATTANIAGDNNKAVPLSFKHILTAVRFETGNQMQPGTIKSITLRGIKNSGTYDMAAGTWALDNATTVFSQTLNKATTGSETV